MTRIAKLRDSRTSSAFRLLLPFLAAASLLLAMTACSSDDDGGTADAAPALSQAGQTGEELATKYITLLQDKDVDGLTAFLSDGFMIQRANGSFSTKADYLTNIPEIGEFTISEVSALQAGDSLVVRWYLTVNEVIEGQAYSGEPAPRLTTFVWTDGDWRLFSHANFNAPEAANPPAAPTN